MQSQRFAQDIDIKVSPKRLWWACIKDGQNTFPKGVPDKIASLENEGGRFGKVGSVRTINLHKGVLPFEIIKAKVEEVDEEKLYIKLNVSDGDAQGNIFDNYDFVLQFNEGVVKSTIEYKVPAQCKFPDEANQLVWLILKGVEGILLANDSRHA